MALAVATPDADGLIISATNCATMGAVEELEAELGVPFATSNQSILWWCLSRLGLDTADIPLHDLGRLFTISLSTAGGR